MVALLYFGMIFGRSTDAAAAVAAGAAAAAAAVRTTVHEQNWGGLD